MTNFPETPNPLAEITSALRSATEPTVALIDAYTKHIEPFRSYLTDLTAQFTAVLDAARRADKWFTSAPEQLRNALATAGTIPHPDLSLSDLVNITKRFEEKGADQAADLVNQLNEELFHDALFRSQLVERWRASERSRILADLLEAHDRGLFGVTVPTALAQAEGIVAGALNLTTALRPNHVSEFLDRRADPDSLDREVVAHFIAAFLFARFQHGDQTLPPFSRHAIIHGADIAYPTKTNSIRALVWVDYLLLHLDQSARPLPPAESDYDSTS